MVVKRKWQGSGNGVVVAMRMTSRQQTRQPLHALALGTKEVCEGSKMLQLDILNPKSTRENEIFLLIMFSLVVERRLPSSSVHAQPLSVALSRGAPCANNTKLQAHKHTQATHLSLHAPINAHTALKIVTLLYNK
jgi:hypothetical protein